MRPTGHRPRARPYPGAPPGSPDHRSRPARPGVRGGVPDAGSPGRGLRSARPRHPLRPLEAQLQAAGRWGPDRVAPGLGFLSQTNDSMLALSLMLDDCDLENGPLLVIPGSHQGPTWDHHYQGRFIGPSIPPPPTSTNRARSPWWGRRAQWRYTMCALCTVPRTALQADNGGCST